MEDDSSTIKNTNGFIKHVFNFDNDTKCDLMNIIQYVVLAIIPMAFFNYAVDSVIPDADKSKSNLEILAELLGQLGLAFVGIFFIHRLVTYVPTYSGRAFGEMNIFSVILIFLVLGYESGSKVGNKTKIILERVKELWDGKKEEDTDKKKKKDKSVVKVTQPISRSGMPTHQASRADYLGSHNLMVSPTQMLPPAQQSQQIEAEDSGANNDMYNNGGFGGLVGANEPAAANEGFGAFTSF